MIDNYFREKLPKFTNPLIQILISLKFTPNKVTILGFLISLLSAFFIFKNCFYLAITFWWLSRLFDGLDGILARKLNKQSAAGGYLDIVLDMAAYSMIIVSMFLTFPNFGIEFVLILFCYVLCITSALAFGNVENEEGLSAQDNRSLRLGAGLAEGGETGIAYTIFMLFPQFLNITLWIWIGILLITVISRTWLVFSVKRS